ncbi:MAG: patatin-like phospholipase family protein [Bacteroidetes bacterium]|nr:patatin-like phospholipase family protein [Bacteroidota bacterium]
MKTIFKSIAGCLLLIGGCSAAFAQGDRIAVISGGGAYGAWGAGLCQRLHDVDHYDYKIVIGTSTGSLMAPLVLQNNYTLLKTAYTSVTQGDIFSVNPFKPNGQIRGLVAGWRFIFNNSLGETYPLRKLIKKWYTQSDYDAIKQQGKELIVTVANMSDGEPYYMSSNKYDYDDSDPKSGGKRHNWNSMVNWIWASANEPVFMSIFKTARFDTATKLLRKDANGKPTKEVYVWQDGGITQAVSVMEGFKKAFERKIYNVDVIVHGIAKSEVTDYNGHGTFTGLMRTIGILTHTVKFQNIQMGLLQEQANKASCAVPTKDFTITIYYMRDAEYKLQPNTNELVFDKQTMLKLYEAGFAGKADKQSFTVPVAAMDTMIKMMQLK